MRTTPRVILILKRVSLRVRLQTVAQMTLITVTSQITSAIPSWSRFTLVPQVKTPVTNIHCIFMQMIPRYCRRPKAEHNSGSNRLLPNVEAKVNKKFQALRYVILKKLKLIENLRSFACSRVITKDMTLKPSNCRSRIAL